MKILNSFKELVSCQKIELPCFPEAQKLLDEFMHRAERKSELERISLSHFLYNEWASCNLPEKLFPGFPERNDYWFLVQLLSMHRYCLTESEELDFDLAKPKTIILPNSFLLDDYRERNIAEKMIKEIIQKTSGNSGNEKLGVVQLPQYDDLLRLSTLANNTILSKLLHLRGYRKRSDGIFNGLIGGNPYLGGWHYLDALPPNVITKKIAFSYYFVLQSAK